MKETLYKCHKLRNFLEKHIQHLKSPPNWFFVFILLFWISLIMKKKEERKKKERELVQPGCCIWYHFHQIIQSKLEDMKLKFHR